MHPRAVKVWLRVKLLSCLIHANQSDAGVTILLICPLYSPHAGGAAVNAASLRTALRATGLVDRVIILTEGRERWDEPGEPEIHRCIPEHATRPDRSGTRKVLGYARNQIAYRTIVPQMVRHFRPDIIHFHARIRGRLFYRALKKSGKPVVADLRDWFTHADSISPVSTVVFAASEAILQRARESGVPHERSALLPSIIHPRPTNSTTTPSNLRTKTVLFVGSVGSGKGVPALIRAFERFRQRQPEWKLVLIGPRADSTDASEYRGTGIEWLGALPHHSTLRHIAQAAILVLPSSSEGLPRVILEALACETPVLAPPGIEEFNRHIPGCVMPDTSEDTILAMLESTLQRPEKVSYPLSEHSAEAVATRCLTWYRRAMAVHSGGAQAYRK